VLDRVTTLADQQKYADFTVDRLLTYTGRPVTHFSFPPVTLHGWLPTPYPRLQEKL
jgi:hypothetical protein